MNKVYKRGRKKNAFARECSERAMSDICYINVDGITAHVNGGINNPETLDAIKNMVKFAYNKKK